jgi:AcrR family transcriptional regulator
MGIRERRERDIEARRKLILSAATDLFLRHGFSGVTLDDIAAAIEFSKGTIYNHFGSKEEIYATILLEHLNSLRASLREAAASNLETAERLQNATKAYVRFYRERREYFQLLFFIDHVSDRQRIPEALLKSIRLLKIACLRELQSIFKAGLRSGEVGSGRSLAQVSLILWGMLNGILQLAESRQIKEESLDRLIGVGFEIVLDGLRNPAEKIRRRA